MLFQLALANPRMQVIHKLKMAKFVEKVGRGWFFLTVCEAVDACLGSKLANLDTWWLCCVYTKYAYFVNYNNPEENTAAAADVVVTKNFGFGG